MSDNMKFLADALAYHTKGRKAFMESKCSCCSHDPCDCPADCDCKMEEGYSSAAQRKAVWASKNEKGVKEASTVNGVDQEGKKRWKTTGLSHSDAVEKHGKDNVKVTKGGLRNGDDHVQVYSEGADEVNDKNINAVHDKDEGEATDNTVKMTNDIIAGKQPYTKSIKSIYEPVKEDIDELLEHTEDLYEMVMELDEMLKEEDMSLSEAFHALAEDIDEDMLEEDFAKMSKTKQLIARRRAGRRKKLTLGYKLNRNKIGKKPQFGK